MKTLEAIFALSVTAIAFPSCSGSGIQEECRPVESLCVAMQTDFSSRIELGTGFETLLNTDDVFSVFHKSPANEIWFYDGADKVASGEIKHISDGKRDEIYPHIAAVSPFNALNSLSYCGGGGQLQNTNCNSSFTDIRRRRL